MNKRNVTIIAIALFGVVALGGWLFMGKDATAATPYRTGEVRLGTVESTVSSTGTLAAVRSVAVGTQVSGRVTELYADYNDRVRQGQLIARIDPTLQRQAVRNSEANLERVRAALAQAEREYHRNRTLFEQQVITETEFNQIEYNLTVARSNVTSAEVTLEQARQNLAYTEIYAPIDGVVVERNVEPGQTVAASMSAPQLYLLASDLSQMEIHSQVDESDIGDIRNGMPVRFTVSAYPNETFQGVVRQVRLSSTTQNNVVNYTAVISVENPSGRLLPGMTANVDFVVQKAENVLMVPNAALRFRATEEMIAALGDSSMIALARSGGGMGRRGAGPEGGAAAGNPAQAPARGEARPAAPATAGAQGPGAGDRAVVRTPSGVAAAFAPGERPGARDGEAQTRGRVSPAEAEPAQGGSLGAFVVGGEYSPGSAEPRGTALVWYLKDGKLSVVQVRTGISDGTNTEISGLEITEGMQIITGLNQVQTANSGTTNPFQQQPQGFGGPGGGFGPPGGFGGGGGGGR